FRPGAELARQRHDAGDDALDPFPVHDLLARHLQSRRLLDERAALGEQGDDLPVDAVDVPAYFLERCAFHCRGISVSGWVPGAVTATRGSRTTGGLFSAEGTSKTTPGTFAAAPASSSRAR